RGRDRGERGQFDRAGVVDIFVRALVVRVGRAPLARQRVIVQRERPVGTVEQIIDDPLHLTIAQHGVGPLHQIRRHNRASTVRQTWALPRTSCTRTMRAPWITPYATDASDSARRS